MITLDDILTSVNLVDDIKKLRNGQSELFKIANSVINGFTIDEKSGSSWRKSVDEAMDIAKQIINEKNFPWEKAANIKYPLITGAAINYAARVLPEIIPNDSNIVEAEILGDDPQDELYQTGIRVGRCMSYQCANSPDWKVNIDRLLQVLPIVGTAFTKTYYDEVEKRNCMELCAPDCIVINHDSTSSLSCARRVTHIIYMSINDIVSRQRQGIFNKDIDVDSLRPEGVDADDMDYEIELYEQHCWLDLDDDGYKEPYVVILSPKNKEILRIVNRIKPKSIEKNKDGEVYCIKAIEYFQDYHFMRSPDGGFYSIGFGQLLLPLNKAINSLINQLIDAGTVSVTQGGFLGKGLRLKGGELRFRPFEWKVLDAASGTDLRDNVFPFPVREPSQVLLSLATFLVGIGEKLSSATEAMDGSMQGTNVAAQTFNGLVEQGTKIFEAINKRFYESLTQNFRKQYQLNYYYLSDKEYRKILNNPEVSVKNDFNLENNNVKPVADPQLSSMTQRMAKVSALMGLRTADPRAIDYYILDTLKFNNQQIQMFLPPPPPNQPPPPEVVKTLSEARLNDARANESMANAQVKIQEAPINMAERQKQMEFHDAQIHESATRSWKIMKDGAVNDNKILITASKMTQQEQLKQLQAENKQLNDQIQAMLKNKELDIKAADNAMGHSIELQKLDKEEKSKDDTTDN